MDASKGRESSRIPLPGVAASNETIPSFFFFPRTYVNLLCFVTELERIQNGREASPSPPAVTREDDWPRRDAGELHPELSVKRATAPHRSRGARRLQGNS